MHVPHTKADLITLTGRRYAELRRQMSEVEGKKAHLTAPGSSANIAVASAARGIALFLTWVDQAPATPGKNRGNTPEKWSSHDAYHTELRQELSKFQIMKWQQCQAALTASHADLTRFLTTLTEKELYAVTSKKQKTKALTLAHWAEVVGATTYATVARQLKALK